METSVHEKSYIIKLKHETMLWTHHLLHTYWLKLIIFHQYWEGHWVVAVVSRGFQGTRLSIFSVGSYDADLVVLSVWGLFHRDAKNFRSPSSFKYVQYTKYMYIYVYILYMLYSSSKFCWMCILNASDPLPCLASMKFKLPQKNPSQIRKKCLKTVFTTILVGWN